MHFFRLFIKLVPKKKENLQKSLFCSKLFKYLEFDKIANYSFIFLTTFRKEFSCAANETLQLWLIDVRYWKLISDSESVV